MRVGRGTHRYLLYLPLNFHNILFILANRAPLYSQIYPLWRTIGYLGYLTRMRGLYPIICVGRYLLRRASAQCPFTQLRDPHQLSFLQTRVIR